jgi:hypothetical protein
MKTLRFCLAAMACLAGLARAAEPPIIAKVRAYLGPESALDAVRSIRLSGTVTAPNLADSSKPKTARVEIVFQKPMQECITVVFADRILQTGLDDYEGWQEEQSPLAPGQQAVDLRRATRLTLLGSEQVRALRADTWENLGFYRGLEGAGGTVEDLGPATIDGIVCEKIALNHTPAIAYYRYFDRDTGRLVYSETKAGARIREQGEIMAGGIRFPKTIVTSETDAKGNVATNIYTFERVAVNESFPPSRFAVPLLPPVSAPPTQLAAPTL